MANLSKESHYSSLNVEPHWYVDDGCHTECRIVNGKPHCTDATNDDDVGKYSGVSFSNTSGSSAMDTGDLSNRLSLRENT